MSERSSIMSRMFLLFGFLLLFPAGIMVQLLRVNVVEGDGLRELWTDQAIDTISIPAQRGNIYDASGSILATNDVSYNVAIDPLTIGRNSESISEITGILSKHTSRSAAYYRRKIARAPTESQYVVLEKRVSVEAFEELGLLNTRGLLLEEDYRRNYNFETLGAHILGFVNHEMTGMAGLEAEYNHYLKGNDGLQQVRKDKNNKVFAYLGAPRKQPEQGYSLHTTIDAQIQAVVEEELENGIERHMALRGTAIVMEPESGAIQAIANYPTFDPNRPATAEGENRRNYAVSDMIEPGSTFKITTAIAAIEQEKVQFDEQFETPENGRKMIHGQVMRDHDPLGTLTFPEVISKSSNIATSEVAMRLDPESFYQYARNLGFGTPTQIDLPNESEGRLQRPYEWSLVTLPWMSIGYEVQVTPMQLIQAYSALANDGILMKPYVVRSVQDEYGNIIEEQGPMAIRRVAEKETIQKIIPILEQVVTEDGTAGWAAVEGLRIAGKTGTAQKYEDGRYQTRYRASFVGFFPVEDPKYTVLVLLDEPKTSIYGGFTAGSIFKEIAIRLSGMDHSIRKSFEGPVLANRDSLSVPKLTGLSRQQGEHLSDDLNLALDFRGEGEMIFSQQPEPGTRIATGSTMILELSPLMAEQTDDEYLTIPDLSGMDMRRATTTLLSLGLTVNSIGSGSVRTQFPQPGEWMKPGRTVTIRGSERTETIVSN